MELSEYAEGLRREVAAVTRLADEEVARAGQLISESLDSSIRLTLLDVLSGAAAEITSRLDDIAVELRLSSGNPTFAIVDTRENPAAPEPPAPPRPPSGPGASGEAEEETGTSRVTLRLPDGLKARAEAAAARDGLSLNTWLVHAVGRALGNESGPARTRSARRGPGTRITGYARS
jgi:hypothetical protein